MTGNRVKLSDVQQLSLPAANHAHMWLCRLDENANRVGEFLSLLSPDESKRTEQFIVEQARKRFIVSRGVLRRLLSGYLAMPASKIELVIDSAGKPRVADNSLPFNLAHSGEWALLGFASNTEVGVDIELHRPVKNWRSIAERHYSFRELAALPTRDEERPPVEFFRIWTRKEAVLKWHGTGLQTPLSSFEVPTCEQCREWVELSTMQRRCWVESLNAPAGYSAALTTSQPCKEIVLREI